MCVLACGRVEGKEWGHCVYTYSWREFRVRKGVGGIRCVLACGEHRGEGMGHHVYTHL